MSSEPTPSTSRTRSQRRVLRRPKKLLDVNNSTTPTTATISNNNKNNNGILNGSANTEINYTSHLLQESGPKVEHITTSKASEKLNTGLSSSNALNNNNNTNNNTNSNASHVVVNTNISNRVSGINSTKRKHRAVRKDVPLEPPLSMRESVPSSPSLLSTSPPQSVSRTNGRHETREGKERQISSFEELTTSNKNKDDYGNESNMITVSVDDEMSKTAIGRESSSEEESSLQVHLTNELTQSTIDREMFSSVNFSSALFVNNVVNRVLYPVVQHHRLTSKRGPHSTFHSSPFASTLNISNSTTTNSNNSNNSNNNNKNLSFSKNNITSLLSNNASVSSEPIDYRQVANELSLTVERAERQVAQLLHEEEAALRYAEIRARRNEIHEKRQLAKIRLGLESTTSTLLNYEHRVHNAQSATTGIEQHLAQSNARVERGRSIAQLLRFFKMFIAIAPVQLSELLKWLSTARQAQRLATTSMWERGRVSHYNPQYFIAITPSHSRNTESVQRANFSELGSNNNNHRTSINKATTTSTNNNNTNSNTNNKTLEGVTIANNTNNTNSSNTTTTTTTTNNNNNEENKDYGNRTERRRSGSKPRPRVLRRRRGDSANNNSNNKGTSYIQPRQQEEEEEEQNLASSRKYTNEANRSRSMPSDISSSRSIQDRVAKFSPQGNNVVQRERELEEEEEKKLNASIVPHNRNNRNTSTDNRELLEEEEEEEQEVMQDVNATTRLHPLEAAAINAGLDRVFAARRFTESQVEWCRKLELLAHELHGIISNTDNVEQYHIWLRQELVADLFHLISCFNTFYEANPQTAIHLSYGRALLSTLELISRLYMSLSPSPDSLVSVFFAHITNDLAVTLFSEFSPEPLPPQLPLPMVVPTLPMEFFNKRTSREYATAFQFIVRRIKRDVILVETIFGSSSLIRQQLLSKVTDEVVRPFITQQIKLAETHERALLNAEALLSPRSKRRCGNRVADAIAFHSATEARLFELFQRYVSELRELFDASEVEFLGKFTDLIFTDRASYSSANITKTNTATTTTTTNNTITTTSNNNNMSSNIHNIGMTSNREMELLQRYRVLIEEKYTRHLHPLPEEFFDLREAHMTKARECMDRIHEVCHRVILYALPAYVGPLVQSLLVFGIKFIAQYLSEELKKSYDSLRADRDNWRVKPKNENELLRPSRPECQQCGFRMLLFVLSTLMSLNDLIAVICLPLLKNFPRLAQDVHDAKSRLCETMDLDAEKLLNMCNQAIIIKSLSILIHYQNRSDYLPKKLNKKDLLKRVLNNANKNVCSSVNYNSNSDNNNNNNNNSSNSNVNTKKVNGKDTILNGNNNNKRFNDGNIDAVDVDDDDDNDDFANATAPPCTRACTLFCYYVTRQFEEAKEFIRLSNGQLPQRQTASQLAANINNDTTGINNNNNNMNINNYLSLFPFANSTLHLTGSNTDSSSSHTFLTPEQKALNPNTIISTGTNSNSSSNNYVNKDTNGVSLTELLIEPLTHQSMAYESAINALRARARSMSYAQLLYGDGGPSSMVRTLGVCLYKGITAHLKSLVANDCGAIIYKQDVTAYKEAMVSLSTTPGLGGAVVEVLFNMLRETSSLLIMPLDHIKAVKESGLLRNMPSEEKMRFIKIRQDVREAFRLINN